MSLTVPSVEGLLDGLTPHIKPRLVDPEGKGTFRILISTPLAESEVATYLTALAKKVGPEGVKVGSYPQWGESHNIVTLVGRYVVFMSPLYWRAGSNTILRKKEYLDSIAPEVAEKVKGEVVQAEEQGKPAEK